MAIVVVTVACIGLLVVGISEWHWYLVEMGAAFLGLSVIVGLIGRLSVDEIATAFCKGAAELTSTALMIGFARAIKITLEDAMVIDTIIHGIAAPLASLGSYIAAVGMFVIQTFFNFFIPVGQRPSLCDHADHDASR